MQTILTLTEKDVYPDNILTPEADYIAPRKAVRVVIFDNDNKVALEGLRSSEGAIVYCMIGGGIEEGEDIHEALVHEAREEAGCRIKNIQELGIIEERGIGTKEGDRFIQTNYCFVADIDGDKEPSNFTEDELSRGYHTVWFTLDDAIAKLNTMSTGFITKRTLFLLKEAKRVRGIK